MDEHSQQQRSEDAAPPDDRLHEGAPAAPAADASSSARTAARRGRGRPPKGKGREKSETSSTEARPRRSTRRSRSAGGRSAERSTADSSVGGGSIRDSAHDRPRGDEIRTGGGYFQIRGWSTAPGDNEEEGPPRQRRKVRWSYEDGSTYVGEALDEKRDGQGTLTRHGGVRDGVFKNGKFDEGTATNVQWGDPCRYTGQIVGGKMNGTGKVTLDDGGEFEGTFVDSRLDKGMAKNMKLQYTKLQFLPDGWTYTGQMAGGDLNGTGMVTSADGDVYEGVFVDGFLNGRGKITHYEGGELKGTFVDGYIHAGTAENVKCLTNDDIYTGQIVDGQPTVSRTTW